MVKLLEADSHEAFNMEVKEKKLLEVEQKKEEVENICLTHGDPRQDKIELSLMEFSLQSRQWKIYYGLGLENGNYTGKLFEKDFDIQKEADGDSFVAIQKEYNAVQGTYGPSISAISATPEFTPTVSSGYPSCNKNSTGLIVGLIVGVGVLSIVSVLVVFYIVRRRKLQTNDEKLLGIDARTFTFSYAELKTATEDFNPDNKLGEGGFEPVYMGTLNDGRVVAVKQLSVTSHQGKNQFTAEIPTIAAIKFICLNETGNRNLNLSWSAHFDICLGVARGLSYLHEESWRRIVHRDVKASNILFDYDLIPKYQTLA
ncbi:hypothetical protein SO802_024017 [Lithocarpus litseifolius]|uniref:Protein kinase domain-containing protein n=1 Tax=Lithocarpus litseifolius TaxID=425828 RepID=A0AAW2C7Y3_9ROSI